MVRVSWLSLSRVALTSLPFFSNPREDEVDEVAMREEMARMRETVMEHADTDKDGLVSESEFLALTKRDDFGENPDWDPLFVRCGL